MPTKFDIFVHSTNKDARDKKIGMPFRRAELSYRTIYDIPRTLPQLYFEGGRFFNHLNRAYYGHSYPPRLAIEYALKMLGAIFNNKGGLRYALRLARTETFSAIKSQMTSAFIYEAERRYVDLIINGIVDPYNYNDIRALMEEYVRQLKINCSEGDLNVLISNYAAVLRSHVKWTDEEKLDREARVLHP